MSSFDDTIGIDDNIILTENFDWVGPEPPMEWAVSDECQLPTYLLMIYF